MTEEQEIPYVIISTSFSPITWTPQEGKVPNAWVRFWTKVFFDCNWVKK
jgi:hypothetical protein